ncbi:MAG: stage III sporulation protein AC [Eubacteriales bacterium]
MDVTLIMRIAGVGILVTVANSILSKSGRDEQSVFVTIAGIIIVLLMLVGEIDRLFTSVRSIFGL